MVKVILTLARRLNAQANIYFIIYLVTINGLNSSVCVMVCVCPVMKTNDIKICVNSSIYKVDLHTHLLIN